MKTAKKALVLSLCAVVLVVVSVMGTVAWLTSQDSVVNTFTFGKLAITMDEAKTNEYGVVDTEAAHVQGNEYKLIPGHSYTKDPVVHFQPDSEAAYLFVKVDINPALNGVLEGKHTNGNVPIDEQITANGWKHLAAVPGTQTGAGADAHPYTARVYYKEVPANFTADAVDYPVFGGFAVKSTEQATDALSNVAGAEILVNAYAVQKDGFASAQDAWNATFGK